jgi:hypothetical protein
MSEAELLRRIAAAERALDENTAAIDAELTTPSSPQTPTPQHISEGEVDFNGGAHGDTIFDGGDDDSSESFGSSTNSSSEDHAYNFGLDNQRESASDHEGEEATKEDESAAVLAARSLVVPRAPTTADLVASLDGLAGAARAATESRDFSAQPSPNQSDNDDGMTTYEHRDDGDDEDEGEEDCDRDQIGRASCRERVY